MHLDVLEPSLPCQGTGHFCYILVIFNVNSILDSSYWYASTVQIYSTLKQRSAPSTSRWV